MTQSAMKQQLTVGPSIHVRIELDNDHITSVDLQTREASGLSFELVGGTHNAQKNVATWLTAYAAKKPLSSLPSLAPCPMPTFVESVHNALLTLPFGKSASYKDLARHVGSPQAARAVGSACGRNKYPLFIPCHRIIASDGGLGGFACGLEIKKRLLEFENIT